jgi:hypothetical protein
MTTDDRSACSAHDQPQHNADDDGVVGVAEHRHEVGHQIDRNREVAPQGSPSDIRRTAPRAPSRAAAPPLEHYYVLPADDLGAR